MDNTSHCSNLTVAAHISGSLRKESVARSDGASAADNIAVGGRGNALVLLIALKWHNGSTTSPVHLKKKWKQDFQTEWENNFEIYQSQMKVVRAYITQVVDPIELSFKFQRWPTHTQNDTTVKNSQVI